MGIALPKKRKIDWETPVHIAVYDYLRAALPWAVVHHSRNEINKRGKNIAKELAAAARKGTVKGFPDLLVLPGTALPVMLFEVKVEGNYPDKDQKALHEELRALGYRVAVVRGVDDTRAALAEWKIPTMDKEVAT